jgi:hypothetical protein
MADGPEGNLPSSPSIARAEKMSKNEIIETPAGGIDLSRDWREAVGLSIIMIIISDGRGDEAK